jgi:RNA recognition motif-containing protein
MSKTIYVGNLSPWTTPEEIRKLFEQYGEVESMDLATDGYSGEFQSFGFVRMASHGTREAVAALDMKEVDGRSILVNEMLPRGDQAICQRSYW